MNKVVLIGRLTKDLELKFTQNGNAVCNFTLAVNRTYKNEQGEYDSDFINCQAWRGTAQFIGDYLRKGYQIAVSGSAGQVHGQYRKSLRSEGASGIVWRYQIPGESA